MGLLGLGESGVSLDLLGLEAGDGVVEGLGADGDPVPRLHLDQPFLLEADQRLADRRAAERQEIGDLRLQERRAGRQPTFQDPVLQLVIGPLARRHLGDMRTYR